MNNIKKSIFAGGVIGIFFFLQFVLSSFVTGILFFPAVVFYTATFVPVLHAFVLGVLTGSMMDSLSLLPFGTYMIAMGIGMTGTSFLMRMVDEQRQSVRAVVACTVLIAYALSVSVVYMVSGYDFGMLTAHGIELAAGVIFLCTAHASFLFLQTCKRLL